MKQHITEKQLGELSEKGRDNLLKWLHLNKYSIKGEKVSFTNTKTGKKIGMGHFTNFFPLLSIGQMIEFLDEKANYWVSIIKAQCENRDLTWRLGFSCLGNRGKTKKEAEKLHNLSKELCNTLWEAVKEVLNK